MSDIAIKACIVLASAGSLWLLLKTLKLLWKMAFIAAAIALLYFFYPSIEAFLTSYFNK